MPLRLRPDPARFFDVIARIGANVAAAGSALRETLEAFPDAQPRADRMRDLEREGDDLTRELMRLLDTTLLPPFDREDAFALASALDDVVDHLEQAADLVVVYGVRSISEQALAQAHLAEEACAALARATTSLNGFADATADLEAVRSAERRGDDALRAALVRLFAGDVDPLVVVRWKDIHQEIEEATNACRRAALLVEAIYLKNR